MKRKQTEQKTGDAPKVRALVAKLNQYRHELPLDEDGVLWLADRDFGWL